MPNVETVRTMVGQVMEVRPRITRDQVLNDLNAAIRTVMNLRPYWSDLITRTIVSVPDVYSVGTASVSPGSKTVIGSGTSWPTNDAVNTTLTKKVMAADSYVECFPGSMNGIQVGSLLYFGGAFPEAAAVVEVTRNSFWCKLANPHDSGSAVTGSSFAGRQFRITTGFPVFTIRAVVDDHTLLLDNPWGAVALTGQAYTIYQAYYPIDPDFKEFIVVKDEVTGIRIKHNIPQAMLDSQDAQRSGSGDPYWIADYAPSEGGVMLYEVYPHQYARRQLSVLYAKSWPVLKRDDDRPPWFIDPTVFIAMAKSKALMLKKPVRDSITGKISDPYYDPAAAQLYANEAQQTLDRAINADESKVLRALEANWQAMALPGNSRFWVNHDPDWM